MNLRAFLYYISGCFILTSLLVVMKYATIYYKLPFEQLLFTRQLLIVIFMLPFMIKEKFNPFNNKDTFLLQLKRHGLFAISTLLWYKALMIAPVNDVIGISSITPILGTVLAIIVLKEKRKKGIIPVLIICFIGATIIKRPSFSNLDNDDMLGYLFAICVVLIRSFIVVLNKPLSRTVKESHIMYFLNTLLMIFFALFAYKFKSFPIKILPYILFASATFFLEYFLINKAYKISPASTLQPLDFSKPIFSIILSYLILNEKPLLPQITGVFVIIIGYFYFITVNRK